MRNLFRLFCQFLFAFSILALIRTYIVGRRS